MGIYKSWREVNLKKNLWVTVAFENEVSSCSEQILEPFYLKLFQP